MLLLRVRNSCSNKTVTLAIQLLEMRQLHWRYSCISETVVSALQLSQCHSCISGTATSVIQLQQLSKSISLVHVGSEGRSLKWMLSDKLDNTGQKQKKKLCYKTSFIQLNTNLFFNAPNIYKTYKLKFELSRTFFILSLF